MFLQVSTIYLANLALVRVGAQWGQAVSEVSVAVWSLPALCGWQPPVPVFLQVLILNRIQTSFFISIDSKEVSQTVVFVVPDKGGTGTFRPSGKCRTYGKKSAQFVPHSKQEGIRVKALR